MKNSTEDDAEDRALRKAMRSAVHDLRQPLASAVLLASSLKRGPPVDAYDLAATIDELERSLRALSDRVHDLRRITNDEPAPVSIFDAGQAVTEVAGQAQPLMRCAGIDMHVDVDPSPVLISGPRVAFDRFLFNLLENAARHARSARQVHVGAHGRSDHLSVSVVDDGVGWASAGPSRNGGLGLDFCAWAVRAFGGSWHVGDGRSGGRFEAQFPRWAEACPT